MLKAWAQLVRLPNCFTAPADVIAGAALAGWFTEDHPDRIEHILLSCVASVCFYAAGMVTNDLADIEEDRRDRPERPLPSGRIDWQHARLAAFVLALIGGICASNVTLALVLMWAIVAYNFVLKKTFLGPLNMGFCRGCNLMLGAGALGFNNPIVWWAALTIMIYITGVTLIARDEVATSNRMTLLPGIGFIAAALLSLVCMIIYMNVALTPAIISSILLVGWLSLMLLFLVKAYTLHTPATVQSAVKFGILSLVVLETIHTTLAVGLPGLLVLLLLVPALLLGKVIYST